MQNMQDYMETEQYAIEEELREKGWQEKYGQKLPELVSYMNSLLAEVTNESIAKLQEIFIEEKEIFSHYNQTDVVAQMYLVMSIFQKEIEAGLANHILSQGRTVEELQLYLESLKFLLYRVDFEVDEEAEVELLAFIKEYNVSMMTLDVMLASNVMRQMNVALKLEQIFRTNAMYKEWFWVLEFINKKWPGNYRILQGMAEIFQLIGRTDEVEYCLAQIPGIYKLDGSVGKSLFDLQEQLWLLHHGEKSAVITIVGEVLRQGLSIDDWEALVRIEPGMQPMSYSLLAERFERKNMPYFAMVCLEVGMDKNDNNEELACVLADMYVSAGKYHEALATLKKVAEPGEMARKFIEALERAGI